jgi:hypothetical protein
VRAFVDLGAAPLTVYFAHFTILFALSMVGLRAPALFALVVVAACVLAACVPLARAVRAYKARSPRGLRRLL